jgi:probable F420-dependent oxidoreductase
VRRHHPARLHHRALRPRGHLPALARGWEKAGKTRADFQLSGPLFVVTGSDEQSMAKAAAGTKQQIAFYGSTPAYRGVLELHGWGDLQPELNRLSKDGKWVEMGALIDDEILETFAVVGEPEEIPPLLLARYGDIVDRLSFYAPYQSDPERWAKVLAGFR